MTKRIRIATIFFILLMLISPGILSTAQHPGGGVSSGETETMTFNGYVNVGETWEEIAEFTKGSISKVEFVLTWTDDEGTDSDPDTLSLMTHDGMHEPKSDQDSSGMVMITWEEDQLNDTWSMAVTCESAGPTTVPVGIIGIITQEESDPGNSFTLDVTFTYSEGMGGGGPPPGVQEVLDSPIFKLHIALMITSVFLFLITGLVAGAYLFTKLEWKSPKGFSALMDKLFNPPVLLIFLVILTFLVFFIAAIPIGLWVAGKFYGWDKMWTGFPAIWNPGAFDMTNADNVSLIVLLLWFIPMYINRAMVFGSKYFKRLFGRFAFIMNRAEKAPGPRISIPVLALCYFFMGIFTYVVFMVQPHGGGS